MIARNSLRNAFWVSNISNDKSREMGKGTHCFGEITVAWLLEVKQDR